MTEVLSIFISYLQSIERTQSNSVSTMAMADLEESLDYAQNFHSFETPKENEKHDVLKGSDFAVVTGIF